MREHTFRAADFVFKSGRMNFAPHTRKLGDAISSTIGGKKYPSFKAALDDFVKDLTRDKVNEKEKK
jgi:hypothetical protein